MRFETRIKVNGIKTHEEAKILLEKKVDIFSFDILLYSNENYKSYFRESRFVTIEEINQLRNVIELPNVSARIDLLSGDYQKDYGLICKLIAHSKLNYVELDIRYDPLPIPIIFQNGISHDDYMPNHYELSKDLRFGKRELLLNDFLKNWQWLKEEAPKYSDSIKIKDIQGYFEKYPYG
jgi:hypothetical protein